MTSRYNLFALLASGIVWSNFGHAQDNDYKQQAIFNALNHGSNLEGAGSHGALGLKLGFGYKSLAAPAPDGLVNDSFRLQSESAEQSYGAPTLSLVKGSSQPVDLSVVHSFWEDRRISQSSLLIQWTIYEAFAHPALALRLGGHRIWGLAYRELQSLSSELIASYGYGRVSAYVSGGWISQADAQPFTTTVATGLSAVLLVPYLSIASEFRRHSPACDVFALQLNVGY